MKGEIMYKKALILMGLPLIVLAAEWQSLNGPPAGRADDMSMGLYEGEWVIYAADKTHKLYKSVNEGASWDSILDTRVDNPTCVITRPNDARYVYIGKNSSTPVWWSENGGQIWEPRSGTGGNIITNENPRCFCMDPNNSSVIYLGCGTGAPVLFKTTDGGDSWSALSNFPNAQVNDIAITSDPVEGTWIYAGCALSNYGIWKSIDGGEHWDPIFSDDHIYSVEFANQSVGYAGSDGEPYGIYKTTNAGETWQGLPNSPSYQVNDLVVINTTTVYAATNAGMFITTNGGADWTEINEGICARNLLSLMVHPDESQTLFAGGIFCVYKTINGGNTWQEIIKGFKILKSENISNKD
jgi:hypothetical protein